MGFDNVGKVWDEQGFCSWLRSQDLTWAKGITIHHTAAPSLEQRPHGLKIQHIRNIAGYYRDKLGWSRGPHLFIDEDQIFGMSSIEERGIHARSFNQSHIGIEVLGDYDKEDPKTGRGLKCWETTAAALRAILDRGGWSAENINFHRDDPRTSKTCPGKKVEREWLLSLIPASNDRKEDEPSQREEAKAAIAAIEWQLTKLKRSL